jgi:hypothetical protein
MDFEDPASLHNVTVDGVGERIALTQAAQRKQPRPPPPPKPPAQPKPTAQELKQMQEQDEFEERQVLLDKVLKYRERFPKLKKRNGSLTIKSSLLELQDEVHYIEQQLGRDENTAQLRPANMVLIATMHGLEHMTRYYYNPLNLNLHGLGMTTQANVKAFEPLLDEFMIKHGMEMAASVELRILLMIGTTVMTVHAANTRGMAEVVSEAKDL